MRRSPRRDLVELSADITQGELSDEAFIVRCRAVNGSTVCATRGNPNHVPSRHFNASLGTAYGTYGVCLLPRSTPGPSLADGCLPFPTTRHRAWG